MKSASISWLLVAAAGGAAAAAAGCGNSGSSTLTPDAGREVMIAPETCGKCHQQHFDEWTQSMHAKAADDPVFLAMNARGQRETNGKLGDFCLQCHAPLAVSEHQTTNHGLDLPSVKPQYKGVTCFFCHSIDGVAADGGSNASVLVSNDLVMRGEIADPVPNSVHASKRSPFQDEGQLESAEMCGYCHDINSPAGARIERTFAEWSATPFAVLGSNHDGQTCAAGGVCHMPTTPNVAIADGGRNDRTFHSHRFPGVDVPLSPPDPASVKPVQDALNNNVLFAALCVTTTIPAIRVILDNGSVGHQWPSGAAQDRRAWIEVIAYRADGSILYSSGVVPAGTPVTETTSQDPDLWLLRDCMFDSQKKETHNFWEAATENGYELPPIATFDPSSASAFVNHIWRPFPTANNPRYSQGILPELPFRVTLRVLIQPVGLDVLKDLVASRDLDPGPDGGLLANMPTLEVSLVHPLPPAPPQVMEWPAPMDQVSQGLVQYPVKFADRDTLLAPNLGPGTCTANSITLAFEQTVGTTVATCKAQP